MNRNSPAYKLWRKNILDRDGGKCQMPGCKKKAKQVHHIIRWADSFELRLNPMNGISLCWPCHHKIKDNEYYYAQLFMTIIRKKYGFDN